MVAAGKKKKKNVIRVVHRLLTAEFGGGGRLRVELAWTLACKMLTIGHCKYVVGARSDGRKARVIPVW